MDPMDQSFLCPVDLSDDDYRLTLANLEHNEDLVLHNYLDVSDDSLDLGISDLDPVYFSLTLSDLGIDSNVDADYGDSGRGGASEEIIDRLKRESSVEGNNMKKKLEFVDCVICLEEVSGAAVKKQIRLPCSHLFHESCIVVWLRTNNSCPMCRRIPYQEEDRS